MGVIGAVAGIPGALYNARPATALYNATTTAATSATRYATRKLTQKTFKVALRKALEHLCERFDLEDYGDESGDGCTSVVARNLVLKRASLDALLSRVGLRLADGAGDPQAPCTIQHLPRSSSLTQTPNPTLTPDPNQAPCTIACVRLVISWRARKDLGLFTEPWRLEIDDLYLQVYTNNES